MILQLPELQFSRDALEPHMSATTLDIHHGKHHQAYVNNGNELLAKSDPGTDSLEELVIAVAKTGGALFNNIGQHYNHSFFWSGLSPNGGGSPTGPIAEKIDKDFGNFETFKSEFINGGASQFGSGWVWLVVDAGKLAVTRSANAETPLTEGKVPLLVCDVWEHAYYLDFQNRRVDFLKSFLDNLVNWDFANDNLAGI